MTYTLGCQFAFHAAVHEAGNCSNPDPKVDYCASGFPGNKNHRTYLQHYVACLIE
jgi:hypothetical protein